MLPSTYYAATASQLIADINAANKGGGSNSVVLTAPTTSPYELTTSLPTIKKSVNIVGNGDTIERSTAAGTPAFRLFGVANGGSLTLQNLTLQNGNYNQGGAIHNQGTLALSQVTVLSNIADGLPGAGGGIWSNGSLTVKNSTFEANVAENDFDGPAYGGAIYIAGGTVSITGSAFGNPNYGGGNSAKGQTAYGGAVYIAAGTVTMSGDTFGPTLDPFAGDSGNSAVGGFSSSTLGDGYGGAVYVAGGTVTLTNDYIQRNYVEDLGNLDGVFYGDYGGYGGGIYIAYGATVYIDSFTVGNTTGNISNRGDIWGSYAVLLQIGSFTASPNPITTGSSLTLTASGIAPATPGATITQVSFYYFDSSGAKHVLGTGTQTSTGVWTLTIKANLAPGAYTLYAQAEDSAGLFGPAAVLTLTVVQYMPTSQPNLSGTWYINGRATSVQQSGSQLTFTNENGSVSGGYFISPSQVVATGWGNLVGYVVGTPGAYAIYWANSTTWYMPGALPNLSGTWNISGRPTQIQQNSTGGLTFTNENGSVSGGYFVDLWHVVASGWGNLVGTIVGTPGAYTIYWANGTVWQE